ncbi:MAG: AI-2E family transporter, partial [Acidobacteria bacterium]
MSDMHRDDRVSRALEVSVNVGLFSLLAAACFLIVRPFLPLVAWGIIIAIAMHPGFRRIQKLLGGRSRLAAVVCTIFLFALLILPVILLTGSLFEGIQSLAGHLKGGMPVIPPLPPRIASWPIVGARLKDAWELASKNLSALLQQFAPQIRAVVPQILSVSAGIGVSMLQWVLSIALSGVLLANAQRGAKVAHSLANRFFGEKGPEFVELAGATIRSVTVGIIGVAFIQSIFAVIGFLVVGLPGAGLWGMIFLAAAVLQLGVVVLVPALIYVFA